MDYDSTLRRARPLHPINIRGHRRLRHHPIGQNQSTIFALPFPSILRPYIVLMLLLSLLIRGCPNDRSCVSSTIFVSFILW
jgi:hypothetical protein